MVSRSICAGRPWRAGLLLAIALSCSTWQTARPAGWLGAYTEPADSLPQIRSDIGGEQALRGATTSLLVTAVFPDSPAEAGGLLAGDLIIGVCGQPLTCPPESAAVVFRAALDARDAGSPCELRIVREAVTRSLRIDNETVSDPRAARFWRASAGTIDSLADGSSLLAAATKSQAVVDLPIVLGLRPEARWPEARANDDIFPPDRFQPSDFTGLVWALADKYGVRADTEDLLARLARCHSGFDPYRLEVMTYVHRDPFRLEAVSRRISDAYLSSQRATVAIARSAQLLTPAWTLSISESARLEPPGASRAGQSAADAGSVEALLTQITEVLADARAWHSRAFATLTEEEREYLERERWNLSDAFAGQVYINFDEDRERFRKNKRLLDLAPRVDYGALFEAAGRLAQLTDPVWARGAGEILCRELADSLDHEIILTRETPNGRILIGGTGRHWYRDTDAAVIIDLGGDDFYTGNCGGTNGWDLPLAVCIDLAGNDAYESTLPSCQGAGCLGVGGLLDLAGDDSYIAPRWCQGSAYLGIGWLHDAGGNDVYRSRSFCQGVGLFGAGILIDDAGNDIYTGDEKVQGVGLAKGIGALIERAGDDEYYAKGLYATGYGDAGIFDGWSQGCGMGFRTLASGGLGLICDGGGADRMEAGNFSQGGGYYYGYGIVDASGQEGDTYIGSRYNQGFCAHQAIGVFFDEGGDDFYTTRQGVAQGLAWDECVTLFEDGAGDDCYQGGAFFSQGASAHNSFCFFFDRAGRDNYDYPPGQARAGGNDYHGGTSFSLFVDEGGAGDTYAAPEYLNGASLYAPQHGFFLDITTTREAALPAAGE